MPASGEATSRVLQGYVAIAVLFAVFILLFELMVPGALISPAVPPTPTSGYLDLGAGLLTLSQDQNVTGTSDWESYCASEGPGAYCTDPVGVAYVPSLDRLVLTENRAEGPGGPNGTDAIEELDPATLAVDSIAQPGCAPGIPFYPGTGVQVFVPCFDSRSESFDILLAVDSVTGSVVANLSTPGWVGSMTYDSVDGLVYAGTGAMTLISIDPVHDTLIGAVNVTGARFQPTLLGGSSTFQLVFDPIRNQLIVPSATGGLLLVDPATGEAQTTLPLPSTPLALAVDPETGRLFAAGFDPDSLFVYNAANLALETTFSPPACVSFVCATGTVAQVLVDPSHGDAYLLTGLAIDTFNLSKLSWVSEVPYEGYGPVGDGTYVPSLDRVFATFRIGQVLPGLVVQLDHANHLSVSRILWLPTGLGTLPLGAVVGSVLVLFRLRRAHRLGARIRSAASGPPPRSMQ